MGIPSINYNNLLAQEMMLYGGRSIGSNCPSVSNGYMAPTSLYNSNIYGGYYNPAFRGYSGYGYNAGQPNSIYNTGTDSFTSSSVQQNQPIFGASPEDLDILGKYYLEGMAPSESLLGAAAGGAAFSLVNNPRLIVHPVNSFYATKATDEIFKGIKKEGSVLNKMWLAEGEAYKGYNELLQEAYANTHKLNARMCDKMGFGKIGLFRSSLKDSKKAKELITRMTNALNKKNPNMEEIATISEEIKRMTKGFDGHISKGVEKIGLKKAGNSIKDFFKKVPLIGEFIKGSGEKTAAEAAQKTITETTEKTFLSRVKTGCSGGAALFMTAIEFLMDSGKIKEAFSKDSSTGWTQVGQTTIKGLGTAIGWGAGEAVGAWAGAKLGAALGTAITPGVGTAIGAALGLVGGMVGSWLTGKITHKLVGQDVGDKVKVEKMKQTAQGQTELLQLTMQQAQGDKQLDPRTAQAIQNVYNVYA